MGENVQCPVCTLFLHAGMSLSDHLETHPKEQVIKALVQMMISGCSSTADGALKAALLGETVKNDKQTDQHCPDLPAEAIKAENYLSLSNSRMSTISTASANNSSCSTNSSLNFTNSSLKTSESVPRDLGATHENVMYPEELNRRASNSKQSYQSRSNLAANETSTISEAFNAMHFSRQQQQPEQMLQTQIHQHNQSQFKINVQQKHQTATPSKQSNFGHNTAQQQLPPPPPPMPVQQQQQQHSKPHEITAIVFSTSMQQSATYAAVNQQRQQQQSPKIIYSGVANLPPPPPLQLFSYQQSTQQYQHQKPPPAYGTAISQIRSQQNQQNKQIIAPGSASFSHKTQAFSQQQQQQLAQHRQMPHTPARIVSHVATQLSSTMTTTTSSISASMSSTYTSSLCSSKASDTTQSDTTRASESTQKLQPPLPPPPPPLTQVAVAAAQKPSSTSVNYPPIVATSSRQTSSPFPALIAAQSPSSVLRFAESPVAHYLERDNGDFIVQETPKHIVECVEEDDGEFSVIERLHQSPPSVLHIHDDNDDDDDDDNGDNDSDEVSKQSSSDSSKKESATNKNKSRRVSLSVEKNLQKQTDKAETTGSSSLCAKGNIIESSSSNSSRSETESNSCSNANTLESALKKTSKNSITVLSDVQLNLNEYLDLMGNIIASGKIAKRRTTCSASAPIPLVKVEKVEPDDEDDYEFELNTDERARNRVEAKVDYTTSSNETNKAEKSSSLKANKNETEKCQQQSSIAALDETPSCSKKLKETNEVATLMRANEKKSPVPPAIHLTSVIRMATTATTTKTFRQQQTLTPPQQQQQQQTDLVNTRQITKETNDETTHQAQRQQPEMTNASVVNTKPSSSTELTLIPQDLSQPQKSAKDDKSPQNSAFACVLPPPPPLRKGPKKLVIKPKLTKTEENAKKLAPIEYKQTNNGTTTTDRPSTSKAAVTPLTAEAPRCQTEPDVVIKCEPGSYEISCSNSNDNVKHSGILERRLKSSAHSEVGKFFQQQSRHQHQTDTNMEVAVDYSAIKNETETEPNRYESNLSSNLSNNASKDSAAADARVLLDFANSTKRENPMEAYTGVHSTVATSTSFFSPTSLFSNANMLHKASGTAHCNQRLDANSAIGSPDNSNTSLSSLQQDNKSFIEQEFIAVEDLISVSCSQSAVANAAHANQQQEYQEHQQQQQQQQQQTSQSHNNFSEYPFSFFYGSAQHQHAESISSKLAAHQQPHSFSPMYQQTTPDATTTAATVASSSTLDTLDDSTSIPPVEANALLQNRFGIVHNSAANIPHQWYQPATLVAHSDFNAALSIDNAAVDGEVGKYLDLDACKRESAVSSSAGIHIAPSSTSSSFAAATESSLAGGCCTTDTLNIRTDEKMPPKGEISEQESNCDIENSWSQPVYGEIPSKFYRTTFPGIFPHDAGWNQDEFFTVQDLSASANGAQLPAIANNSKSVKSFDFHSPLEAVGTSFASAVVALPNDDVFPSTSMGAKKRKKRDSEHGSHHRTAGGRSKPTSTITSQQFMQNETVGAQNPFEPEPQPSTQILQRHQKPSTSSAAARAASTSNAACTATSVASTALPNRVRRKVYVCPHCSMEFSKLRDKNHHMIEIHNYVRQNRRLISSQSVSIVANVNNSVNSGTSEAAFAALNESQLTNEQNATASSSANATDEYMADSKQNIKIKMEYDQPTTASAMSQPLLPALADGIINPKTEFVDEEKANVLKGDDAFTTPTNPNNASSSLGDNIDSKLSLIQPLSLASTPTTKLATLYRMLISFNVSILKQNQNLSELDEKLIESSIFFCYTCRTNFSSVKLYDAHLTEHPAECFTCGKNFQRWKNFSLHLKRHLGWKEFGCNVCDKKFVVRSALVEHTRMHTGHTPLKCKVCGKSFKRYSNLTQHRKRHGRVVVRKKEYVCHCGEVLPSKARFLWHKETHDSKPKCCPHCCDRFVHANSLRRHIRLAHSDKFDYAEPMECPMCKQVFAKSSIKAHMATHSMDTQHDCNICNKSFSTKWNLKIHLWVHANRTAKPFKCEHCPKAFVREVDFKNHMNAHKQIKPYTCEYCGCKFIRKYNYMRHRREHHGNKKFTCDLCKKSFHRHYYLIEHRRIHTGERPFQCTICGKSSTTKTNHNKHLRIHHSRDPFTVET